MEEEAPAPAEDPVAALASYRLPPGRHLTCLPPPLRPRCGAAVVTAAAVPLRLDHRLAAALACRRLDLHPVEVLAPQAVVEGVLGSPPRQHAHLRGLHQQLALLGPPDLSSLTRRCVDKILPSVNIHRNCSRLEMLMGHL